MSDGGAVAELKKKLDLKVDAVPTFTIQLAVHVVEPRAFVPQSGTLKGYTFVDLSKACSRLYRRGFLKSKLHFTAFFKYYKIISTSFQMFARIQDLCNVFFKIQLNL